MRKHLGRNPKITMSILASGNYHALHDRLYNGMHRCFSEKNIVIMICKSGRHRSVANAELWSNTLTGCSRHQHSVSLLQLSELDFWENTCGGNCSECGKQRLRVFQAHYDQVQAECLRRVPVPDPVTGRWKRPRPEHAEGPAQPVKDPPDEEDNLPQTSKRQATSATATSAETSRSCGTLDELAQGLGSFRESARAMASCLQKYNVPRELNQSMIETAKCMFHMRCVLVVHPYSLAQEDTTLLTESAFLSCAKICVDDSRFSPDLQKDRRVTLNKETKERNIRQHSIHNRDPSDYVEFTG